MRSTSSQNMPWTLSLAQKPPTSRILYKTDDDVSVHRAFEMLVKTAVNNSNPCMSRLRRGISTIAFNPATPKNTDTIPEVSLKQLMRLYMQANSAHLDVQIGLRGSQLILSARKRDDTTGDDTQDKQDKQDKQRAPTALSTHPDAKPSESQSASKKRGRSEEEDATSSKRSKQTSVLQLTPSEKARWIAHELGLLRESLTNGKIVDTVLINLNKEESTPTPSFSTIGTMEVPKVILVVKLISGAALALNDLYTICKRYSVEDGLFTSRNLRQANLSDIGTPTWRAAKAQGLVGATLLLNVT